MEYHESFIDYEGMYYEQCENTRSEDIAHMNNNSRSQQNDLYISTSLVTAANITLADLEVQEFSQQTLTILEELTIHKQREIFWHSTVIDPAAAVKDSKTHGIVESMLSNEDVLKLSAQAAEMHLGFVEQLETHQPQDNLSVRGQYERLSKEVIRNHRGQDQIMEEEKGDSTFGESLLQQHKLKSKEEKVIQRHRFVLDQINKLYYVDELSMKAISQRLRLKYSKVETILRKKIIDPEVAFRKCKPRPLYHKLHQSARTLILTLLMNAKHPLRLSNIQDSIRLNLKLRVSKNMIWRYMNKELNVSYRKILGINTLHNRMDAKLQRQYAASKYIEYLYKGFTIYNVDESCLYETDHRSYGWQPKSKHNQVIQKTHLEWTNLIAAVSNRGEFAYTINRGKTNAKTFQWFLLKLCTSLNSRNANWRKNTIIMMDNAQYHRSCLTQGWFQKLKMPIMFLGPYHFKLSPVELYFNYIKGFDLQISDRRSVSSIVDIKVMLKELALTISRISHQCIPLMFYHVLTYALADLSLTDL